MNTALKRVGVIGATSLIGQALLPVLADAGWNVVAYSRHIQPARKADAPMWKVLPPPNSNGNTGENSANDNIPFWICAAPIWILPDYYLMFEKFGARRVIAISSTSRFTKSDSTDTEEKNTSLKLIDAENRLEGWAKNAGVGWMILRPTLTYGLGRDKNISEIIRLIRRLGFFPLLGQAKGLRQPVHAEDVAVACLSALERTGSVNRAYNLSGGETLTYREMVKRIFIALGKHPRLISMPPRLFRPASTLLRLFPRYRQWNNAMAERMNADLVFDHTEAERDLNFKPRNFHLTSRDLPVSSRLGKNARWRTGS